MKITDKIKTIPIADIKPYSKNAKLHNNDQIELLKQSIKKYSYYAPIGVGKKNEIIFGHGRYEAIKQLGESETIEVIDLSNLSAKEIKKLRILDNKIVSNEYDDELLKAEIESIYGDMEKNIDKISADLGYTEEEFNESFNFEDEKKVYTNKIKSPIYEITGEKPTHKDLYNTEKSEKLISEIQNSEISDNDKLFLIEAAKRHTVFSYQNIAEFYAHSNKEVQNLMEKSALIIIDYEKAIENGFVRISEKAINLLKENEK